MSKKIFVLMLTVVFLGLIAFGRVGATSLEMTATENMYGISRPVVAESTVVDHIYGSQNALLYDSISTMSTETTDVEDESVDLTEVEGEWTIDSNGVISTVLQDDNKAILGTKNYADVEFSAYVKVIRNDAKSDAGLFFRASNVETGSNAFTGYYVGLDAYRDKIVFGRVNNDWSNLATVSMTIDANTFYKLSVRAVGNNLKIFVNDVQKANVTDSSPILTAGAVGLRASLTGAEYKDISYRTIYPLSVTSGSWTTSYSPVTYTVSQGADDKVSFSGHSYENVDFTAYVNIGRDDVSSDAGLFFRASNIGTGTNAFTGYYVGLNANKDWLLLGRVNNGWTGLRSINMQINKNQYYKLRVKALDNRIQVYLDDVLLMDMVDMNNPILSAGAVGLRASKTSAIYQMVEVNENPSMISETFDNHALSITCGTWSDDNTTIETYSVEQGADDKAVLSERCFTDMKFSAYMKIGRDDATSDAGIIFRARNIGTGANGLTGYYVGMDAYQDKLWLGRLNHDWTGVKTVSMTVNANEYYKVTIEALGANIKVYINDELKINVTDSSPILTAGAIGFRANKTAAWYTRVQCENTSYFSGETETLTLNQIVQRQITDEIEMDIYSFTPSTNGTYLFLTDQLQGVQGKLYSASGILLSSDTDGGKIYISKELSSGNTYYLEITSYGQATGNYQLGVAQPSVAVSNATDLTGATVPVSITTGGTKQVYRFIPETTGLYTVKGVSIDSNTQGKIYNFLGDLVSEASASNMTGNSQDFCMLTSLNAGSTYYLVTGYYNSSMTGEYTMAVYPDDYYDGQNNNCTETEGSISGIINHVKDKDVFKFTATQTGSYVFQVSGAEATILNENGTVFAESVNGFISCSLSNGTTYYFEVESNLTGTIGTYTLTAQTLNGADLIVAQKNQIVDLECKTDWESPSFFTDYTVTFQTNEFEIYDLCGFTYKKELQPGITAGGVTILSVINNEEGETTVTFRTLNISGVFIKKTANIVRLKAKQTGSFIVYCSASRGGIES